MNHDKYREFVILVLGRCFHTEVKAVLAHAQLTTILVRVDGLWWTVSPFVCLEYSLPRLLAHWGFPSKVTHWCFCVWDSLVKGESFMLHTFYFSLLHCSF